MNTRWSVLVVACFLGACAGGSTSEDEVIDTGVTPTSSLDTGMGSVPPCVDGLALVSGSIVTNTTFVPECTYVLQSQVVVGRAEPVSEADRVTLTVRAGTRILGDVASRGSLVISQGGRLVAEGQADAPIVMTSSNEPGSRAAGDWGGLVLNGNAPINCELRKSNAKSVCVGGGPSAGGSYGGVESADNSGFLRYLRIEFAGASVEGEAWPALSVRGVGSGTTLDFVQVHRSGGAGVRVLGGTGHVKHLVVSHAEGPSLQWNDGWTGGAQFVVLQSGTSGSAGIVGRNSDSSLEVTPRSSPTLANMAVIGSPLSSEEDRGVTLSGGTAGQVWNSQVVGFTGPGLALGDLGACLEELPQSGLLLSNVILDGPQPLAAPSEGCTDELRPWFLGQSGNVEGGSDLQAGDNADNPSSPSFTSTSTGQEGPSQPPFEPTVLIGAVDAKDDWTVDWTSFSGD